MSQCLLGRVHAQGAGRCHVAGQRPAKRAAHRGAGLRTQVAAAPTPTAVEAEDAWIAGNLQQVIPDAVGPRMKDVADAALEAVKTLRMPTTRNEDYRFTDLGALTSQSLQAPNSNFTPSAAWLDSLALPEGDASLAVVVDGVLRPELSRGLANLPAGCYIGSCAGAPATATANHLGDQSASRGGPFSVLNSLAMRDALCVVVQDGTALQAPLHILYVSTGSASEGTLSATAPRLLVVAGRAASVDLIEEYVSAADDVSGAASSSGRYYSNSVAELVLGDDSHVTHGYVQREGTDSVHVKCTLVSQAQGSSYRITQASLGGRLSRHDLGIKQLGEGTNTEMRHFLLVGADQVGDLHSKLVLDHPNGSADQLHKCIVVQSSGRGVFDGNVQVNRLAQRTDAGQLSRNLLLVPRATVHVKPNLQIIADDVKCTHGCAVSDLSDEEIFYFQARGIPASAARQALVYSFGAEVMQQLGHKPLVERLQADVSRILQQQAAPEALAGGSSA